MRASQHNHPDVGSASVLTPATVIRASSKPACFDTSTRVHKRATIASSAITVKTTVVASMAAGEACPEIMIGDGLKMEEKDQGRCDETAG